MVLGDPRVGKTSLIQTVVSGNCDMVRSSDTNQMCDFLNLHNSLNQEIWNHNLSLDDGNAIPVTLYDTKNSRCTSTINQLFRDMHGFIIVCDINNL